MIEVDFVFASLAELFIALAGTGSGMDLDHFSDVWPHQPDKPTTWSSPLL